MKLPAPEEASVKGVSTVSTSRRFPEDQLLRRWDFTIYARPRKGPALWKRHGDIFTHEEALRIVREILKSVEKEK